MESKDLIESSDNIKSRVLDLATFTAKPPDMKINKPVCVYSNGSRYCLIPLSILLRYPVVYGKYFDQTAKKEKRVVSDITITLCPYTLTTVVYFGKYKPTGKLYKDNITLQPVDDPGRIITQLDGKIYNISDGKTIFEEIRRGEAKIMTLRNAITTYTDCLFLDKSTIDTSKFSKINKGVNGKSNKIVYGVEYISSEHKVGEEKEDFKIKSSYLIPKKTETIWDIQRNGIKNYIDSMIEKIREKGGLLIPSTKDAWLDFHPESKQIKL